MRLDELNFQPYVPGCSDLATVELAVGKVAVWRYSDGVFHIVVVDEDGWNVDEWFVDDVLSAQSILCRALGSDEPKGDT
jgi:hypothetical protein